MAAVYVYDVDSRILSVIALSGLGGHAFGSFKERGGDYMWIRDALPYDFTVGNNEIRGIGRVMIYGYNSAVEGWSFQNLEDLATSFHHSLLALTSITSGTTVKPVIFIAHSLGGLILKQVGDVHETGYVLVITPSADAYLVIQIRSR